jgi:hypothetical protein
MLERDGKPVKDVFTSELFPLMEAADVIIAHNIKFDKTVLESVCARIGLIPPKKRWLCTLTEVPYPDKYRCKQLSHLAYDHGLPMDTRVLHRAVHDVRLMLDLILTKYCFSKILAYADEPWLYLKADIPAPWTDGGKGKEAATKIGYSWEKARGTEEPVFPKTWVKRVKLSQADKEIALAAFPVIRLNK